MKPPADPKQERITFRYIAALILEQLNLERGLGYTIKGLILKPKEVLAEYLFEDRRRMVKPLPFLLLAAALTTFLTFHFLGLESSLARSEIPVEIPTRFGRVLQLVLPFVQQYFNIVLIISLPFQALATFLVFREQRLFYAEHLVINAYLYSVQTLGVILFIPFIKDFPWVGIVVSMLVMFYLVYAFTKVFEQSWMQGLLKTVGVYILTQAISSIFFFIALGIASLFI